MSRPKSLDPRVDEILENDRGNWTLDKYRDGFVRGRQLDEALPGYETSEHYKARPRDIITWTWLDDKARLLDRGQPESEKLRGIIILQGRLEAIAKRLGEI
jgi:hypothetical protein